MISETIDRIVARRKSVAGSFTKMLNEAESWEKYAAQLLNFFKDEKKSPIWYEVLADSHSEEKGKTLLEKLDSFYQQVHVLLGDSKGGTSLRAAEARANREYVNLGIIGPWRIGKSQIIQQLTHLDTWFIPTEGGLNCTACPINVVNDTYKGESDVAVIETLSVEEMCSMINEYIKFCHLESTVRPLSSKTNDSFIKECIERGKIISKIPCPEGVEKGYYDKMHEYIDNAKEYYEELGKGSFLINDIKTDESKAEYRPYVSYYARPGDGQQTFKCLAVKEATLYVTFRFLDEEVGKLRLMDTPGIGECKLKVSEGLSKALRYDLDIAVATASAKPNFDDQQQIHSFHEILKKETRGRHPENWLFYMFNCYSTLPSMTVALLKQRKSQIITDLEQDIQNGEGICLQENHFEDIDALINKGIECPDAVEKQALLLSDCREEGTSLSSFYERILNEMVTSIERVDGVFYDSAKNQYYETKENFDILIKDVADLIVYKYDNVVDALLLDQMSTLVKALGKISPALNLYYRNGTQDGPEANTLSKKISLYCSEENIGKTVLDILNCSSKTPVDSFDSLFARVENSMKQRITDSIWRLNQDFDEYIHLRKSLLERIKKDILSQYDKEAAEASLNAEKSKILNVFKNDGKFGEICNSQSDEWYLDFINILNDNGHYPELLKIFEGFVNYSLTVENQLELHITKLFEKNQHMDLFIYDEDDLMPFTKWGKALKAFTFSLYNIESSIKSALGKGDDSYESIINEQEEHFKSAISPIMTIPWPSEKGYSEAGKQLYMLYKEYSNIFKNEKDAAKNALAVEWNNSKVYKAS